VDALTKFSMEQMIAKLSARSRMTSISYSSSREGFLNRRAWKPARSMPRWAILHRIVAVVGDAAAGSAGVKAVDDKGKRPIFFGTARLMVVSSPEIARRVRIESMGS
jgi:hypothetical protein